MAGCERQISTENGILTCDLTRGHKGMHHARSAGGKLPAIDHSKTKDGEPIFVDREPLDIQWPQEGMNEPVIQKKG